ncbi:hypothetical protein BGZ94_009612 [Podila epigama]|nr:hypothetical protein BGZ94_009612 [Podila epigama]
MDPYDFQLQQHMQRNGISLKDSSQRHSSKEEVGLGHDTIATHLRGNNASIYNTYDQHRTLDTLKRREQRNEHDQQQQPFAYMNSPRARTSQALLVDHQNAMQQDNSFSKSLNRSLSRSLNRQNGEPLTIRDILDSKEIRNQIAELRRSTGSDRSRSLSQTGYLHLNGSTDPPGQHQVPLLNQNRRLSNIGSASGGGGGGGGDRGSRGKEHNNQDFTIDQSMLEREFRTKLDAVVDNATSRPPKIVNEANSSRQDLLRNHTNQTDGGHSGSYLYPPRSPATQRRQRDLYHSSYSPSEFSHTADDDPTKDNGDDDDGERTVELKPGQFGIISSTPIQTSVLPPTTLPMAVARTRQSSEPKTRAQQGTQPVSHTRNQQEDPGYDSAEISFEREVAIARAKRELGASINGPGPSSSTAAGAGATLPLSSQDRPTSSRLERGRGLVLEDLASPTSYKFGLDRGTNPAHDLITRPNPMPSSTSGLPWPSSQPFPLFPTGRGLGRLDLVTETEDQFMEMAGSLGEGQAVASVLGTLKGMVRQLKSEKKTFMGTIKELQKDLKRTQRDLEKANKSKERLSKALQAPSRSSSTATTTATAVKSTGKGKMGEEVGAAADPGLEMARAQLRRERDQVEKNMILLQQKIKAQEQQMEEMCERDRVRTQQEADLLFLIDTESEQEDEDKDEEDYEDEDEDEDEDTDAGAGADDDEEEDEGQGVVDQSSKERAYNRGRNLQKRVPRTKQRRQGHQAETEHSLKPIPHGKQRRSSKSAPGAAVASTKARAKTRQPSVESRRATDKVEEVHIHHHVHYSDDEEEEDYHDIRSRQGDPYLTDKRFGYTRRHDEYSDNHRPPHFLPRSSYRAPPGTLQIPIREVMSQSYPGQRSKQSFKDHRHHQYYHMRHYDDHEPDYEQQAAPSRFRRSHGQYPAVVTRGFEMDNSGHSDNSQEEKVNKKGRRVDATEGSLNRSRGGKGVGQQQQQQQQADAATSTRSDDANEDEPQRTTIAAAPAVASPPVVSLPSEEKPATVIEARSDEQPAVPATIPPAQKAPQKKLAVDIQRILSLLKAHDPGRCTVCQSGDSREKERHHRHLALRENGGKPLVLRRQKTKAAAGVVASSSAASSPSISTALSASSFRPPIIVASSSLASPPAVVIVQSEGTIRGGDLNKEQDDNFSRLKRRSSLRSSTTMRRSMATRVKDVADGEDENEDGINTKDEAPEEASLSSLSSHALEDSRNNKDREDGAIDDDDDDDGGYGYQGSRKDSAGTSSMNRSRDMKGKGRIPNGGQSPQRHHYDEAYDDYDKRYDEAYDDYDKRYDEAHDDYDKRYDEDEANDIREGEDCRRQGSQSQSEHEEQEPGQHHRKAKAMGLKEDMESAHGEDYEGSERRLYNALRLLEDEVRELRASYLDLTKDLEILTLESELIRKRSLVSSSVHKKHNGSMHNELDSLNHKKKLIQDQLRMVCDHLESKAEMALALQEQTLQEQRRKERS